MPPPTLAPPRQGRRGSFDAAHHLDIPEAPPNLALVTRRGMGEIGEAHPVSHPQSWGLAKDYTALPHGGWSRACRKSANAIVADSDAAKADESLRGAAHGSRGWAPAHIIDTWRP